MSPHISLNLKVPQMEEERINFAKLEESIHGLWEREEAFKKSNELAEGRPEYVFYDGPPFATGLPHYGHILSGTIKDTVTRFYYMQGFRIERKFGWDCHGLPVEYEIDKMLNITCIQDVLKMGIGKYNSECRNIVLRYTKEWEAIVKRMGRWIDFRNGYRTMDLSFMESVWHVFKMLYEKGSVYRGHRVMPYSTACSTPLSNFEANQNYKDVSDPSVLVSFPLLTKVRDYKLSLVAWTTTPWTLTSNLAVFINRGFTYAVFRSNGLLYAMQKDRVGVYFKGAEVLDEIEGKEMEGLEYEQPFRYFDLYRKKGFFRVYHADFVSDYDGTGIVHSAPGFGEEDYKAMVKLGLAQENELVPSPLDEKGRFNEEVPDYKGVYVKDADKKVIKDLKDKILMNKRITHRYPFCWRSDTPLLYRLVPSWFVRIKQEIPKLLETNSTIKWVPESIGEHKFRNWLAQGRDWAVSRNRFWGTPIPLWHSNGKYICVGSVAELEELTNRKISDIHRESIDDLVILKEGEEYRRISEVFDCWFESGAMPYAQKHWPFENSLKLPADFIAEGVDQTRGWFYTLHAISSILFGKAAFKNCIVNGIVLASDNKKMSKRLKNYADPMDIINKYGADSLRLYLISGPVVHAESMSFSQRGVNEVLKNLLIPWYNCFCFYSKCSKGDAGTEMDGWILNSLNSFGSRVEGDMKKYHLSNIMNYAVVFINDLCNWYIRMNRKALREGASRALRDVLLKFSTAMGPFAPFFSEYMYQSLSGPDKKEFKSVHYERFPCFGNICPHDFDEAKKLIEAIRKMRETRGISLKTPLRKAQVVCGKELQASAKRYADVIRSECFLLEIEFLGEEGFESRVSFKPNFSEIRKSGDKERIKAKIKLISEASEQELAQLVENNLNIEKKGVEIRIVDVLYKKEFLCDGYALDFDNFSVILDTEITPELNEIKTAREFFSFVQRLRKKAGFKVCDSVFVHASCRKLVDCVLKHYDLNFCGLRSCYELKETFKYMESNVDVYLYPDSEQ